MSPVRRRRRCAPPDFATHADPLAETPIRPDRRTPPRALARSHGKPEALAPPRWGRAAQRDIHSHLERPSCFLPRGRPSGCRNRAKTPDRTAEFLTAPQAARFLARHHAVQTRRNDGLFLRRTQIPSRLADRPRCGTPNSEHLVIPSRPGRQRTILPAVEPAPTILPPPVENPRRSR